MSKTTKEEAEKQCKETLENHRKYRVKKVKIIGSPDSCLSCKEHIGKEYLIEEAPIIPNIECTNPCPGTKKWQKENANKNGGWCRCDIVPVIPEVYEPSEEWKNSVKSLNNKVKNGKSIKTDSYIAVGIVVFGVLFVIWLIWVVWIPR